MVSILRMFIKNVSRVDIMIKLALVFFTAGFFTAIKDVGHTAFLMVACVIN